MLFGGASCRSIAVRQRRFIISSRLSRTAIVSISFLKKASTYAKATADKLVFYCFLCQLLCLSTPPSLNLWSAGVLVRPEPVEGPAFIKTNCRSSGDVLNLMAERVPLKGAKTIANELFRYGLMSLALAQKDLD